jgi:excisionase family DNA binding protein
MQTTTTPQRWLSIEEAAKYASVGVGSIRRLLADGSLIGYRPRPGSVRLDAHDIDAWILSTAGRRGLRGRWQKEPAE